MTRYIGGTAAVAGLALLMVGWIPPDDCTFSGDSLIQKNRYLATVIQPNVDPAEQMPEWMERKSQEAGNQGKRHRGDEGRAGDPKERSKKGLMGIRGPRDNPDPRLAREEARKAGVLGIFRSSESSHVTSIFGRDTALGRDAVNALGSLIGSQVEAAYGVNGLGLVGPHRGGGGTGEGTFGLSSLGTIGKCVGDGCGPGTGAGYYRRGLNLESHRPSGTGPDVTPGKARVRGGLDREIIRRVIRSHLKEVKFCYESELIRHRGLYGRVTVQFTITPMGTVSAAAVSRSTLGNANVEGCIARAVQRWQFPRPVDGNLVIVSYPFVLRATGR